MLALIGGTGFDRPGIIEDPEEIDMETPYGRPSAPLIFGRLGSRPIVFLRRHGVKMKSPAAGFDTMSVEDLMRTKETIEDLIAEKEMQDQSVTVEAAPTEA